MIVGNDETPTAEGADVYVGGTESGVPARLVHAGREGPIEPTDATIDAVSLTLSLTSWGMLDGGSDSCEQSQLTGYYFDGGFLLQMNEAQESSLPPLAAYSAYLCGLYMVLEPRSAAVTHPSAPALELRVTLSDGRAVEFVSNEHLFLVAELGALDPARVTMAIDPLAWLDGLDLGDMVYDEQGLALLSAATTPDLHDQILARISLALTEIEELQP